MTEITIFAVFAAIAIILAILGSRDPNRNKSYYKKNKPLLGLFFTLSSFQVQGQYQIENGYFISQHNNDTIQAESFKLELDSFFLRIESTTITITKSVQSYGLRSGNTQEVDVCDATLFLNFKAANRSELESIFITFKNGKSYYFPNK